MIVNLITLKKLKRESDEQYVSRLNGVIKQIDDGMKDMTSVEKELGVKAAIFSTIVAFSMLNFSMIALDRVSGMGAFVLVILLLASALFLNIKALSTAFCYMCALFLTRLRSLAKQRLREFERKQV